MLHDRHLAAIEDLVAGKKRKDIEGSLGISHAQLYRWTRDPEFVERWEQERVRRHQERADMMWRVAERAMDVVLESLDEGDPKMAADMLKLVAPGLVDVRRIPVGPSQEAGPSPLPLSGKPKSYECGSCGKRCKGAGGLASHKRTHGARTLKIGSGPGSKAVRSAKLERGTSS